MSRARLEALAPGLLTDRARCDQGCVRAPVAVLKLWPSDHWPRAVVVFLCSECAAPWEGVASVGL